ncbi:GntR family transcriptional regulator [Phreatobacter sp. AB_2022a]|uniref:GntR family transcriptional regulator n=1 Tax=Phreatobacter sp. AB_2022a TaxID=3003134 RepID=UPI002286E2E8|nr:GntR family transcriptional regulator [Phreatobacter sp. AB_2022a]MCZ0732990.1 GntR family transcriptional regulator [Phreatobacter sp. AB_2022a]
MANVEAEAAADGGADVPLYQQVVESLRASIAAGTFAVGERLPTEDALCRSFGVSRHTVREALRALRGEGLIESRQGAGSTVVNRASRPLYTYSVTSIEELLQYAEQVRYEVDKSGIVVADAALAARLGCKPGERWLRVEGFRYAAGETIPVCWTEVYVRADYAGIALKIGKGTGTVYSWIEEMYGVRVESVEQTLRGEPLPDAIAPTLGAAVGSMAVGVHRHYRLGDGSLIEVASNLHPVERFRYSVRLNRRG